MAKRKPKKDKDFEKLSEENEFLKLKMMAEFGGEFFSDTPVPPEVENMFLKQIQKIQRAHAQAETITIFELIGSPELPAAKSLGKKELKKQLKTLLGILEKKKITLNFYPTVPLEELYRFITEEFFFHKVENMKLKGWRLHFNYEDFYPNPEMDIAVVINDAVAIIFEKETIPLNFIFDEDFKDANGLQCDFEDFLERLNSFHASFEKSKVEDIHSIEFLLHEGKKSAYEKLFVTVKTQAAKRKRYVEQVFEVDVWLILHETGQWQINRLNFSAL